MSERQGAMVLQLLAANTSRCKNKCSSEGNMEKDGSASSIE